MPLDFYMRRDGEVVDPPVQLSMEHLGHIIRGAKKLGLTLIMRMEEYYDDSEFLIEEVPLFRKELEAILGVVESESTRTVLKKMISVASACIENQCDIEVIAD